MPDAKFDDPRLARIYDPLESDRSDLDAYAALVTELGARRVLDIGCGTGTFACLLAERGIDVVGVDPAAASLEIARAKPGGDHVHWVLGDLPALAAAEPDLRVQLATMTGNVAQVFVTDAEWAATLAAAAVVIEPGGWLVFETRVPEREAWRGWDSEPGSTVVDVPGVGVVDTWNEVTRVELPLVTFVGTIRFVTEDLTLTSASTLRFRGQDEITATLDVAGFDVDEVRDAPDRPGAEWVFVARRRS